MLVSELIEELQKQPQDAKVLIDCRDVEMSFEVDTEFFTDGCLVLLIST